MANLTDQLALAVSGTDPQNLMEYIVRQRIYDSRFWKEECFGLSVETVLQVSVERIQCIGGTFGGNSQPTRFLSLVLKLLQLQPSLDVVEELLHQEEFKYTRCLAAMYHRLTGRPADIYQNLETILKTDYRKLRMRTSTGWELWRVDEFVYKLLRSDRICGVALPRLPLRSALEEEGHLDGPYVSPLQGLIEDETNGNLEAYLEQKAKISEAAAGLWKQRQMKRNAKREQQAEFDKAKKRIVEERKWKKAAQQQSPTDRREWDSHRPSGPSDGQPRRSVVDEPERHRSHPERGIDSVPSKEAKREGPDERPARKKSKKSKKGKSKSKYGSLFKSSSGTRDRTGDMEPEDENGKDDENSEEYWNEQRAKLGLAPLRK